MEYTKDEEKIIKTSMQYSCDQFWNTIENAAESKDKNEVDVAIGLILEGVLYMKQAGMTEQELIDHIKSHYNSFSIDQDGNIIESKV
tara:strand:- start:899 stop:1159 length:261 start_codon:yes stop_codon:yes gene_type:complete